MDSNNTKDSDFPNGSYPAYTDGALQNQPFYDIATSDSHNASNIKNDNDQFPDQGDYKLNWEAINEQAFMVINFLGLSKSKILRTVLQKVFPPDNEEKKLNEILKASLKAEEVKINLEKIEEKDVLLNFDRNQLEMIKSHFELYLKSLREKNMQKLTKLIPILDKAIADPDNNSLKEAIMTSLLTAHDKSFDSTLKLDYIVKSTHHQIIRVVVGEWQPRIYALKTLHFSNQEKKSHNLFDIEIIRQIKRLIVQSNTSSPEIAQVYSIRYKPGENFSYLLEYGYGTLKDLSYLYKEKGIKWKTSEVMTVIYQINENIKQLMQMNFTYLNITPETIIFSRVDLSFKLIDFGVSENVENKTTKEKAIFALGITVLSLFINYHFADFEQEEEHLLAHLNKIPEENAELISLLYKMITERKLNFDLIEENRMSLSETRDYFQSQGRLVQLYLYKKLELDCLEKFKKLKKLKKMGLSTDVLHSSNEIAKLPQNHRGQAYILYGDMLYEESKYHAALEAYQEGSEFLEDPIDQAKCYKKLGAAQYKLNSLIEALDFYMLSLDIFNTLGDSEAIADAYYNIANIHFEMGQEYYADALGEYGKFLEKLTLDLTTKNERMKRLKVSGAYTRMSIIHRKFGNQNEARLFGEEAETHRRGAFCISTKPGLLDEFAYSYLKEICTNTDKTHEAFNIVRDFLRRFMPYLHLFTDTAVPSRNETMEAVEEIKKLFIINLSN